MNTLLAILKVADARRDVILAGGLYHRFSLETPPKSASLIFYIILRHEEKIPF